MDDLRERMRESVARAICEVVKIDPDMNIYSPAQKRTFPIWEKYERQADAAIAAVLDAIREPDEHLMQLGAVAAGDAAEVLDADLAFGAGFTAMIDELRGRDD